MKFTRQDKYHETSNLGYTVCAIGDADGWKFEAWFGKEQIAVRLESAEAARRACERHAAGMVEKAS